MDAIQPLSNENPRKKANTLSVLFWWWTIGLFKKGFNKVLDSKDLYEPLNEDKSSILGDQLEICWQKELKNATKEKQRPSLFKAIFLTFRSEFLILGIIQLFNEFFLNLGIPLVLGGFLRYFKSETSTTHEMALLYACGISIAFAVKCISENQTYFGLNHVGGKIRIAVCSIVYRKALRLSRMALGKTAPGKIVNLMANDVNRFDLVSIFIHHMWSAPLFLIVVSIVLFYQAGYVGLVGVSVILFVVPVQVYLGALTARFRFQTAVKTDERIRLLDEIITGIQSIKMYAWEKPFCASVELARKLELKFVRNSNYIRGLHMTFVLFNVRLAMYSSILAMILSGEDLSGEKIFVFASFFNILSHTMTKMFVRGYAEISECLVAVRRVQNFLECEEIGSKESINERINPTLNNTIGTYSEEEPKETTIMNVSSVDPRVCEEESLLVGGDVKPLGIVEAGDAGTDTDQWAIELDRVSAKWDSDGSETILQEVSVRIEKGELCVLIGPVGSGKSSFLSSILGEMDLLRGSVTTNGTLSYAGQEAWVFGASVRQNILFGQEFDQQKYQRVVGACALLQDFKQLGLGDESVVGERGNLLSGGQKARINLARAVFRQADIYLLDDPLSSVDTHVGKHIFEECIQGYLKGKTRVLVTHQLQYVKFADSIVVLDGKRSYKYSDYQDLLDKHPEYRCLVGKEKQDDDFSGSNIFYTPPLLSTSRTRDKTEPINTNSKTGKSKNSLEKTSKGSVQGCILWIYFRSARNLPLVLLMISLFILTQLVASWTSYFVNVLVIAEESRLYYKSAEETTNITIRNNPRLLPKDEIRSLEYYISVYSTAVTAVFILGVTRSFVFYIVCLRCSRSLHNAASGAILHASMQFFDSNPSGRILNRFSKDILAIDEQLPKSMLDAGQILLTVAGSVAIACAVNQNFILIMTLIGFVLHWVRKVYLKTSKNIKRLEGMTKSPIFTHLNATLNGLSTIRACGAEKMLKEEFDNLQDIHSATWYMYIATRVAFTFSLDFLCFLLISVIVFTFVLLTDSFSDAQVGLVLTQVMFLASTIQHGMRQAADVENQMTSVERVLEYSRIPPESSSGQRIVLDEEKEKDLLLQELTVEAPNDWPSQGLIEFKNVSMRYHDGGPPILKNLTLTIQPNEKIGIVGRTGAGKSTLISTLFRIAKVEGIIELDGIDTVTIELEDLRRKMSIIPQMPVLFSGSLRHNLDPFDEFSDNELWEALEQVQMKSTITAHGLESQVFDRGGNYSVGQRQLICLARAILRNNKVLILDEATANIDPCTDALIQRTIKTKFSKCTVLTVAHRLNTIIDSDKVLVMDEGRLVEFDHPHKLLQNEFSIFSLLMRDNGPVKYD